MTKQWAWILAIGWGLATTGLAAAEPAPGSNAWKWARSIALPPVVEQEKQFFPATNRANFTFFDGVKDVRVENGLLKFALVTNKAVLGWGNYMGKQPLAEVVDMCDEINEVTLRVRQTGTISTWSKQVWADGVRLGASTLSTNSLAGAEWQELKFISSTQHGGATIPTPDGLEFEIQGEVGQQMEIAWVKLTQTICAGYVRAEFTLPKGPVWRAIAEVGARPQDCWYGYNKMEHRVFINGKEVQRRGVRWPESAPVDIAAYLKSGKNCVGLYGYWREAPMVFFQTRIVMQSGEIIAVQTDKSWKYTAAAAPGWNQAGFDDGQWQPARLGRAPEGDPAVMSDYGLVWLKNPAGKDFFYRDNADAVVEVRLPAGLKAKAPAVDYVFAKADAEGKSQPVKSARVTDFTEKDGSLVYTIDLGKQPRGVYTIAVTGRSAEGVFEERAPEPLIVLRKLQQKEIEGKDWFEGLDVELEDTIDFTNPADPHPWIEALRPSKWDQPALAAPKTPTIVSTNGLTYREAPWYFSYRFQFKSPGSFYLLELEYPDDARRIIAVSLSTKYEEMWSNSQSGVGAETGGRYYLTGKIQTLRWIHVADPGVHSVDVFSALPNLTAAAKSLKIYRIKGDLPAVKVGAERQFGIHSERCYDTSGIGKNFGIGQHKTKKETEAEQKLYTDLERRLRYLQFLQDAAERYTQYLKFAGQNTHIMGVYQYNEDNTPFQHPYEYNTARIIPSLKSVLANTFELNGIDFYAGIEWSQFTRAGTCANNAQVARGADTIWMVDADGKQLYGNGLSTIVPNWMHPANRDAYREMILELGDKFGHRSRFKGLHFFLSVVQRAAYYPPALTMPDDLQNPYHFSYDDATFRRFEQETGLAIPIAAKDPQRFAKRAQFIRNPAITARYRDWRCQKLQEFLTAGFTPLRQKRQDLRFLNIPELSQPDFYRYWLGTGRKFKDFLKDYSMNTDLLNRPEGMTIGLHTDSFRIWQESFAQNPWLWLPRVDSRVTSAFDQGPLRYVLARVSWDENALVTAGHESSRSVAKLVESDWIMDYTRTRTLPKPGGVHCREALMQAIIASDVNILMNGFTDLNISVGAEQEIRELVKVFTCLPSEKFQPVLNTGFESNLVIRKLVKAGQAWFYVANPGYWNIKGTVTVKAGAGEIRNVVSGKPVAVEQRAGKTMLPVSLKPYGLIAFKVETSESKIQNPKSKIDFEIESYTTEPISPEELAYLEHLLKRVDQLANDPEIRLALAPADREYVAGILQKAQQALKEQNYARAWAALTDTRFWALWQDFLEKAAKALAFLPSNVQKEPLKKNAVGQRVLTAYPVRTSVTLDGKLEDAAWQAGKFQVGFVDKEQQAALAETGVKALYDDQALYLGLICADKHIQDLKSSKSFAWQNDGLVIVIQPDSQLPVYYQLGFNPAGAQFHQKVTGGERSYTPLPGWKAVTAVAGSVWTAEVCLPYSTFGWYTRSNTVWRINVHRVFRDNIINPSSWSFCGGNFHDLKTLGQLEF